MLRRLSVKFSAAAIAVIFCVELLMTGLINGLNIYYTISEVDEIVDSILENKGKMPENFAPREPRKNDGRRFGELRYSTRYFTVMIDPSGEADFIDTGHISTVTSEQAQEMGLAASKPDKKRGFYSGCDFRYAVNDVPNGGKMLVFYDFSEKSASLGRMLEISAVIAAALLALSALLIALYSKRAVRPVIESIESQRRFITDAGHELKTPLAVIRADAEVIELTGGENEWTKSILNQTDRLSELLSQLLTLTKSQENLQSSFAEFSLSEAVEQAAQGFKPLFDSKSLPFEINVAEGLALFGSETLVRELVSILLENASKYSSAGESVSLTLVQTGGKAELKAVNFCDDPPQGDTRLLFERFYRADSSRTRETGGSGIGLSIARSIADAHKAKISCNVEGKRVGFCVRFPKVYKKVD
ncbi:two component system histidine kinase [Ruminococcus sp. CAG:579]|nr:two component system histidine kinase [Ruminococcus sp. CAG:579]